MRVEGLGTFHRRDRGWRGGGRGLLYLLAPEMRAALGSAAAAATTETQTARDASASFRAWLAARLGDDVAASAAVESLAAEARRAVASGKPFVLAGVGTLTRVTTVPMGLMEADGTSRRLDPRAAIAFDIDPALKARL